MMLWDWERPADVLEDNKVETTQEGFNSIVWLSLEKGSLDMGPGAHGAGKKRR